MIVRDVKLECNNPFAVRVTSMVFFKTHTQGVATLPLVSQQLLQQQQQQNNNNKKRVNWNMKY